MKNSSDQNFSDQLRQVAKDAIDYFHSVVNLIQARVAEMALSGFVFVFLMVIALLLGIAAFFMFNIAFYVWLTYLLDSQGVAFLVLGTIYGLLAYLSGAIAIRWLKTLKS